MTRAWKAVMVGGLVGCLAAWPAGAALAQGTGAAMAQLRDASGRMVGTATFAESGGAVRITLQGSGLPAGTHGIHIHEAGRCDAPSFTTAGDHFNPGNRQHGLSNPSGPHAGDLPNLTVAANGTASYSATSSLITLGAGPSSLFDADGSALLIHADADDQMSNPSGMSGGRMACGVIVRGASALPATGGGAGGAGATGLVGLAGAAVAALGALVARGRRQEGG